MALGDVSSLVLSVRYEGQTIRVPTDPLVQHAQLLKAFEALGVAMPTITKKMTGGTRAVRYEGETIPVPIDPRVRHLQLIRAVEALGSGGSLGGGILGEEVASSGEVTASGQYFYDSANGLLYFWLDGGVKTLSVSEP